MLLTEAKRWENILYNYFRENHPDLADSWNQPIRNLLTQEQVNTMEAQHQNIDTPLIIYYKAKFCSLFDINRGKGPIKYVPGLARISFKELGLNMTRLVTENNCPQEIGVLKNIVRFIECTPELNEKFDEDLNGLSYFDLYDTINPMRKNSNRLNQERLSSLKLQNKNYRVIPIHSQEEASRYSGYTSWCITTMLDQWENYTRFGRRFYFLLKEGFENIPRPSDPAAVGAPFDAYGLSMISVLVDMEGEPTLVTTRYNHEFNGENNPDLHTAEQVQNITGINFYKELKPYTSEELHSMGIVLFDEVPELLTSGEDIYDIFDDVDYERLLQIRKATVKFHVQPYKYLKDESKVSLSITTQTSVEVENKGLEVSKPIFMLEGSGTIEIAVNGINIFKYTFPNGENKVIVDSLKEEAYLEGVYKNRNMLGEFPKLEVGNNTISWTGTLTKIEIEPKSRWL